MIHCSIIALPAQTQFTQLSVLFTATIKADHTCISKSNISECAIADRTGISEPALHKAQELKENSVDQALFLYGHSIKMLQKPLTLNLVIEVFYCSH